MESRARTTRTPGRTSIRAPAARAGAMDESGFRLDIQGLRGFALVLVLATHADLPYTAGGFVGLDVFYVLSGFLITGLIMAEVERTGSVSLLRFYARRARRLLPAAVTVLAAIHVASLLLLSSVRAHGVAGDMLAATLYVANWRFMAQSTDYFASDGDPSPVQHYWSLSVEEQFYLVWPVVVLGALWLAVRFGRRPRALLGAVLIAAGLASLAYGVWFSGVDPQQSYFSTLARAWELALGCGLALVLPAGLRLRRAAAAGMAGAGLAVLVAATVVLSGETPYPGLWALAPTLASAAVIVAGTSTKLSGPIRLLSIAPLQYLGRLSYSWYLWHWPALVFAAAVAGTALTPLEKTAVTLASWVPAALTHHAVEERFRRSRTLGRRPRLAAAFGVACTIVALTLALSLTALRTTVPTAAADDAPGATALADGETLQRSARAVRPSLREAEEDRGRPFSDGCHLKGGKAVRSPDCVYGRPRSRTTVVNFGDSHALMYASAVIPLARRNGWRMVNLTRAGCTVAAVTYERVCDEWVENSLRRIERERPALVIVSNGTDDGDRYSLERDGEELDRDQSQRLLERGFRRTLKRLRRTGARVVVIRDIARSRRHPLDCIADHADDLARCARRPARSEERSYDARGARGLKRVKVVDPLPLLCPVQPGGGRLCPAVIGSIVVYRNTYHLTATFARTLAPWLGRRLPKLGAE